MSSFAPGSGTSPGFVNKKDVAEYFDDAKIPKKIKFEGEDSENILAFKYYDENKKVLGKTMKEWLRFSVCYWHTFRGTGADMFGFSTLNRPWEDGSDSLENAERRLRVAFEFFSRLGNPFWTFHDRDIAPEGKNLEETNSNLDKIASIAKELQEKTGVKLLWGTSNLFANPRYMNGAATNPDLTAFAYAAAQVKKCMQITKDLGGDNFVFWGGREGYQTILNTDIKKELDHFAAFLKMAVDYKKKIGFGGQLLIEPKPREPTKHQYDYDAQTVMGFLNHYGLEKDFKLNIEPNHTTLAGHDYEHDIEVASRYGMLGSVDSNTGDTLLGWDTDQFPMDFKKTCLVMQSVVRQGGLAPGGLNFDCKVRRESTEIEDMFIAHIGAMDCFARGLLNAARIIEKGTIPNLVKERYSSWDSDLGKKVEKGESSFEELAKYIEDKGKDDEPKKISGGQEKYELLFNQFLK